MSNTRNQRSEAEQIRINQIKTRIVWGIAWFFAICHVVLCLFPFFFMLLNSFRKQFDMLRQGVFHLPDPWYFQNYVDVVTNDFFGYLWLSVWFCCWRSLPVRPIRFPVWSSSFVR